MQWSCKSLLSAGAFLELACSLMLNDVWEREMGGLCTVLVSWRKEIGLESSVCMGTRASADPCNSLESTGAVECAACSMGEQRARSISCRIKSRSFISLYWREQDLGPCTGFWGWALRPIQPHTLKEAIRKLLKTSVKSFSGWPALCWSNEKKCWEGAIVLHKPAAPELCVMELVSVLFKAAVPGLGILWLLSGGLQVSYSGNSWSCSCPAALLERSLGKDVGSFCWESVSCGFFFPFCCLCTGIPRAVIYRNSNMKGTLQGIISIWTGCSSRMF